MGGSRTIKRIKTYKRSTLKRDALNVLIMISINLPTRGTTKVSCLIKRTTISFGERSKRNKKAPAV